MTTKLKCYFEKPSVFYATDTFIELLVPTDKINKKHNVFHEKNVQRFAAKSVQYMSPYIKYLPLSLQFHVVKKHGERA